MSHDHGSAGAAHSRRLIAALALTASFTLVEAVVGYLSNSLVLLADAGHMLTDVAGMTFALLAIWFARRPATVDKTYGYYRVEILAALANALLLFGVSGYILFEAYGRLTDPPEVHSVPLLVVATLGLLVNLLSAWILMSGAKESLNIRGAFLEVMGDLLGSAGAIAAAVIMLSTGWRYADPLFAAAVGLFIIPRTFRLLREAIDVLLEATPRDLDFHEVADAMNAVPGAESVHDLHIWAVTSGFVAMSGHVEVNEAAEHQTVLADLRRMLHDRFEIDHVTLQLERSGQADATDQPCLPNSPGCFSGPVSRANPTQARQT